MFCTRVAWVCLLLCKEEGSSPVSAITERRDKGLYEVPLFMFCWVWDRDRDYVSQVSDVWNYVVGMSSLKHTHEECESKSAYVF